MKSEVAMFLKFDAPEAYTQGKLAVVGDKSGGVPSTEASTH